MILNKDERKIYGTMIEWSKSLGFEESFLPADSSILVGLKEPFKTIRVLIDKNILQVRDCQDLAYEFTEEEICKIKELKECLI